MDNMKKIFTLLALLISALTMSATDYTDTMTVSINNKIVAGQKATISLNQADGKYEFKLNNFFPVYGGTADSCRNHRS